MQLEDFLPNIYINLSNTKEIKDCENVPDQKKLKPEKQKHLLLKLL